MISVPFFVFDQKTTDVELEFEWKSYNGVMLHDFTVKVKQVMAIFIFNFSNLFCPKVAGVAPESVADFDRNIHHMNGLCNLTTQIAIHKNGEMKWLKKMMKYDGSYN